MVAVILVFCLPLQGVAGVTMPACEGHDPATQILVASGDMPPHCMHAMDEPAKQSHDGKMDKTSHDKCYACYLSVAQALTPSTITVDSSGATASFLPMINDNYQTLPSSLFHPPRSISA
ncbi:MAG TPA: hypothetical protein VGK14_01745 [Novimethylophilus sp.]